MRLLSWKPAPSRVASPLGGAVTPPALPKTGRQSAVPEAQALAPARPAVLAQAAASASGGFSDVLETIRVEAQRLIAGFKPVGAAAPTETAVDDFAISGLSDALKALGAAIASIATPAAPAPAPAPKAEEKPAPAPAPTYTVQSGDSLSVIAGRVLGDTNRWRDIFELNRDQIANPNVIQSGMVLKLPGGANAAPTPAPAAPGPGGDAPYINQYQPAGAAQGYWNGPANCGPTSMAMIARAFGYGAGMPDAKLINHLGQMGGTSGNGTNVSGIAAMARGIGKAAETRGPGANVAWIAAQLRAGKLVVANGDYFAMGGHDRSKIGQGGHYVAVVGLDGNGNFLVNDPADSSINGRAFTPDELAYFIQSNSNGGYQIAIG